MTAPTTDRQWPVAACGAPDCRRAIIWARTEHGARSPVDAAPTDDGRWLLADVGTGEPVARFVKQADRAAFAGQLHRSHWASCPKANSYRRPR
jgi:hypothetical protein